MNASTKVGRVFGIDVQVHVTFWLLLAYVGFHEYMGERSVRAAVGGVGFVLLVFATVVVHELGHAAMARRFGIATKHITLYPTGGVAQLERMPEDPRQELLVALAGPAVNVALAVVSVVALVALRQKLSVSDAFTGGGSLLARFAAVNTVMALFNLLPAFPMDGGRVLRAVLAMRTSYVEATRRAAGVGRIMAVVLALVGILASPMLVVVAVFVWIGATAEATEAKTREALSGLPVQAAMLSEVRTIHPDDTLGRVAELLLETPQVDFPVLREGRLVGMLAHDALIAGLASEQGGREARVASAMTAAGPTVEPMDPLLRALTLFSERDISVIAVMSHDHLVGLLTLGHIGELLLVRGAIDEHEARVRATHVPSPRALTARPTT